MHRFTVEFRIEGESLDADHVTALLGLTPAQTRRRGERRGEGSVWDKSLWALDAEGSSGRDFDNLEDGLDVLLAQLEPKLDVIHCLAKSYDVYWWCGDFFEDDMRGGPRLSPQMLRRLADFGAELIVETYSSGGVSQ